MSHANIPRSRRFSLDTTVSGIREFGFGANFDPLSLFADEEQGVWYDPSDKSTLFQDVAGTIPVVNDGDPVALMRDKSGNGNHVRRSTSAARPVYKTDGNLHWLEFDGVDDYLDQEGLFAMDTLANNAVIISVFKTKSAGALLSATAGGTNYSFLQQVESADSARHRLWYTTGVANRPIAYTFLDSNTVFGMSIIDNKELSSVNGEKTEVILDESTALKTDGMSLRLMYYPYGGPIYWGGRFYGGIISKADIVEYEMIEQYLAKKAGVTL